ncbi:MAG: hypothetical protein ACE5OZ_17315 [Candidatus Heimdallarchaeota archaeon]
MIRKFGVLRIVIVFFFLTIGNLGQAAHGTAFKMVDRTETITISSLNDPIAFFEGVISPENSQTIVNITILAVDAVNPLKYYLVQGWILKSGSSVFFTPAVISPSAGDYVVEGEQKDWEFYWHKLSEEYLSQQIAIVLQDQPIKSNDDLTAIFGPKAHEFHPGNTSADPNGEWIFNEINSMANWDQETLGGSWDENDTEKWDKTILNHTLDVSSSVRPSYEDGWFLTASYYHSFIRVVNETALLQWDLQFTKLMDMCAIKMAPFNPLTEQGDLPTIKEYPVIGYAAGSQDIEARSGNSSTTWNLVNNSDGEILTKSGINRLVLQVASISRQSLAVDVAWSDMVYRADLLTTENRAELANTTGRENNDTHPYPLKIEAPHLYYGGHYGLNASGEVKFYPVGADPDYPEFATYRIPVRQAMWRAEVGEGTSSTPIQHRRGWSFKSNPARLFPSGVFPTGPESFDGLVELEAHYTLFERDDQSLPQETNGKTQQTIAFGVIVGAAAFIYLRRQRNA